jgi:hypothetical protein
MKNIVKYVIVTQYGDKYETDAEGRVIKFSNGLNLENASKKELNTWIVRGLHEIKPFNQLGRLIPLSEAVHIKEFHFKNGHPKYTLSDIDHGTIRIVGNWNCHGVRFVEINK